MVGPTLFVAHPLFPVLAYCLASLAGQLDRWALAEVRSFASEGAAPWEKGPAGAVEAPPALLAGGLALDEAQARRLQMGSEDGFQGTALNSFANAVITCLIVIVIAYYYHKNVTEDRGGFSVHPHFSLSGGRDFAYPWYGCFGDMTYCCFGFCCQQERVADTYATAGVAPFWTILLLAVLFLFLNSMVTMLLAGLEVSGPDFFYAPSIVAPYLVGSVWACYLATKRQALRMKLGGVPGTASLVQDCLCYWWCGCCTIIQDARQVDGATDTRVACCCNLMQANSPLPTSRVGPAVVGNAVGAPTARSSGHEHLRQALDSGKAWR